MRRDGCLLVVNDIPMGFDPDRTLFVLNDTEVELYRTVTSDLTAEEIREVKSIQGQIYRDLSGKTTEIDFQKDLGKMQLCSCCAQCLDKARCPGVYEQALSADMFRTEQVILDLISSVSGAVLDVGCGHTRYADVLRPKIAAGEVVYTGLDPFLDGPPPFEEEGCSFVRSGIEEFKAPAGSFDAVLVLRSHNHFKDRKKAYRTIEHCLKPGGRLIVVDNLPYAVVRQRAYTEVPAGEASPQQHCQNDSSWDVISLLQDMPLYLRRHMPVRDDGFNQWTVLYQKKGTGPIDVLMVAPPLLVHTGHIDHPYFADYPVLEQASRLVRHGFRVEVVDALAVPGSERTLVDEAHYRLGAPVERIIRCCKKYQPRVIVLYGSSFNYSSRRHPYLGPLISGLRKEHPKAQLVYADLYFSGMHFIDIPAARLLKRYPELDHVLKGAAERTLPALVAAVRKGGSVPRVVTAVPEKRDAVFPDWTLIDAPQYQRTIRSVFADRTRKQMFDYSADTLPVMSTYGCVYACVFCSKGGSGAAYGEYSLLQLAQHVKILQEEFQVRRVVFLDALVNLDPERFMKLLSMLKRRGLACEFPNGVRADRLERRHVRMVAGLVSMLSVSAESGDQRTVDIIVRKKQSLSAIENVAVWCRDLHVPLLVHYMIGLPGETRQSALRTVEHAVRMEQTYDVRAVVQYAVPLPGTELEALCRKKNISLPVPADTYMPYFSGTPMITGPALTARDLSDVMTVLAVRRASRQSRKLIINLTYQCQNRCRFCAIGARRKDTLPKATVLSLLKKYRARGVRLVDFDGGEPTLHPDLFSFIAYAERIGYQRITVTTNGRALSSREYASRLLLSGITDILISVHGHTAELHDAHTTKPGSFKETLQGLRNIVRLRPERVSFGVNVTLTKLNAPHIAAMLRAFVREGVRKVTVQYVTPFGTIDKKIVPAPASVSRYVAQAIDRYAGVMDIQIVNLPFCYLRGYERYVAADVQKKERTMVFVSKEQVNLSEWLGQGRRRIAKCGHCVYSIVCDGVYHFSRIRS